MSAKTIELGNSSISMQTEKKVDNLITLSQELVMENPKKALALGKRAYQISKELNYSLGMAQSLYAIAFANRNLSDYDKTIPRLLEAIDIFVKLEHEKGEMKTRNLIGTSYFYL
ncbi:hypothetical protein [Anaerosolibacter sp.]|uniref:hypothetical protein n=1 Tax=Anaerosolibacter sp. TaxID=1872527 RepID=UPI0039EEA011